MKFENSRPRQGLFVVCAALCLAVVVSSCGSTPAAAAQTGSQPNSKTIDQAIQEAAQDIESKLEAGIKIAALSFNSPSGGLSEYVLEELSGYMVNGGKLFVVDRSDLDAIRAELDFNLSDEVDDRAAQEAGRMLGAQYIVSGSFQELGDVSRIRFKTIAVQSAGIAAQSSADVMNDSKVQRLLASSPSGGSAPKIAQRTSGAAPAQSGAVAAQPPQGSRQQPAPIQVERQPVAPAQAALRNGTYTFYPRLQVMQGGVDKPCYLDRIVVRSGYLTVYLVNTPIGKGSYYGIGGNGWAGSARSSIILQDLDNPSRTWNPTTDGEDSVNGGNYITFEKVTATRFSLTNNYERVPLVFDEIILGEPDR
jgi:TolB-like protein